MARRSTKAEPAPPNHNSALTPNNYLEYKTEELRLKADAKEATKALSALRKKGKKLGINAQADKLVDAMQDPALLVEIRRYGKWRGKPIPIQDDLLDERPTETAAASYTEAHALQDGWDAAVTGKSSADDNPHPPGSVFHERWALGHRRGQEKIAGEMERPADQTRKRREPPGRLVEDERSPGPYN